MRESAGGWSGIAWVGGVCGFVWRNWSSCADFSTANAAISGLVGNQLTVFGLLAEVRSFRAVYQYESLVDTVFSVLLPHFIRCASSACLNDPIEVCLILRAFDAGKCLHVPNRPFLGATRISA